MNPELQYRDDEQYGCGYESGLRICGRVTTPLVLGIDKLRTMEPVESNDLLMICGNGDPKGCIGHCRGVLLADIINKADILITDHNDTKKMFIIASSNDGYKAVFSWQEIFNTAVGDGVMVLLERDGKPLYGGRGPVDLFSARDYLTGPRYVKQLGTIEVVLAG